MNGVDSRSKKERSGTKKKGPQQPLNEQPPDHPTNMLMVRKSFDWALDFFLNGDGDGGRSVVAVV